MREDGEGGEEIVTCDLRNCVYGFVPVETAGETRVPPSPTPLAKG